MTRSKEKKEFQSTWLRWLLPAVVLVLVAGTVMLPVVDRP